MTTITIAKYQLYSSTESIMEVSDYMEEDKDYVRLTEPLEVELIDLPAEVLVPMKIDSFNYRIKRHRDEANTKIEVLETAKAKLMALTHDPD